MEEGVDFYLNEDGFMVFTETYHKKRGYCCRNKCKHCPWGYGKVGSDENEVGNDEE